MKSNTLNGPGRPAAFFGINTLINLAWLQMEGSQGRVYTPVSFCEPMGGQSQAKLTGFQTFLLLQLPSQ